MMHVLAGLAIASVFGASEPVPQHVVDQGISIDFASTRGAHAGEPVEFSFRVSDATGAAIAGVRPAAWLSLHREGAPSLDCKRQVATYLGGDLFNRAAVDLNAYFVLSLNDDNSISVVDPLFGFGGSRLLAMLELRSPGADWSLNAEQTALFVSLPASNSVAVADTRRWKITKEVSTGPQPRHLLALADRIAVSDDDGVTLIDASTLASTHVHFGAARALAAGDDNSSVFAASGRSVVRIDAHHPQTIARVELESAPDLLAYSSAAKALYALDSKTGRIYVIDAHKAKVLATIDTPPGAAQIRFAPNGRYALIVNAQRGLVQVLDAATNRIVQNADVSDGPDRITFSDLVAYIHRRASETVLMIPLEQLGRDGQALNVADFPAGQHALGDGGVADSIVAAPEGPSVLVANPDDKMIYLYREGMAAPAGGLSTSGHRPRAALVVDHGLREQSRGRYATTVPVREAGTYDVALFLDSPRVIACFAMTVDANASAAAIQKTRVAAINPPRHLVIGTQARLEFALTDAEHDQPRSAEDVRALVLEAPGVWQRRVSAKRSADGHYEVDFVPPESGTYYVWIESASLGLDRSNSQFSVFLAN